MRVVHFPIDVLKVETMPVVHNLTLKNTIALGKRDLYLICPGMLHDIAQSLLEDAVEGGLDRGGKSFDQSGRINLERDPASIEHSLCMRAQGSRKAKIVQH